MFIQNRLLRELVCAHDDDAQIEIRQANPENPKERLFKGHVSRARAIELLDEDMTAGIGTTTHLRFLLAHPGKKIDLALKAKQHLERGGTGSTAEACRTVFRGDGDLALNYSHKFKVCAAYSTAARRFTSIPQAIMLLKSKAIRLEMELGVGIS